MQKLKGKIITGLQHCEDQDVLYKAYVVKDVCEQEIEILDEENLDEWLLHGGDLRIFSVDRNEVVKIVGNFEADLYDALTKLKNEMKQ